MRKTVLQLLLLFLFLLGSELSNTSYSNSAYAQSQSQSTDDSAEQFVVFQTPSAADSYRTRVPDSDPTTIHIGNSVHIRSNVKVTGRVYVAGIDLGRELKIAKADQAASYVTNNPMFMNLVKQRERHWKQSLEQEEHEHQNQQIQQLTERNDGL